MSKKIEIIVKDRGRILVELYPEIAPKTCENFVELAEHNFYDGLIFHRVIKNFMIQGGCPDGTGMGGAANTIVGEFQANGIPNSLKHERGVISMARSNHMDSASSQFFIMHKTSPHLDGKYAAFGKVVEGMDVVDAVAETATNQMDRPIEDQVIESIRVIA